MRNHTTVIESTIDRIDTNLIRIVANTNQVPLYRLTMQDTCYFIAAGDVDAEAFKQIDRLQPGMPVSACIFDDHGRRRIAWIVSNDLAIPPYDALAQKEHNLSLLTWASCVFVLSLLIGSAAFNGGWALVFALTVFVSIISLLGTLIAIGGLSELVFRPQRREAQEKWQCQPPRLTFERSNV